MPGILSRIYLYLSKDYFSNFPDCNIEDLLKDVAERLKTDDNGKNLYEDKGPDTSPEKSYCMGRIKKHIIKRASDLISGFEKAYSTETLGQYISKAQMDRLVRVFKNKKGGITAYAFIIFHVIFNIVKDIPNYDFNNLQNCTNAVYNVVIDYCNDYADDPLAHFMLQCYELVSREVSNPDKASIDDTQFPPIPQRHHNDYNE